MFARPLASVAKIRRRFGNWVLKLVLICWPGVPAIIDATDAEFSPPTVGAAWRKHSVARAHSMVVYARFLYARASLVLRARSRLPGC